MKIMKKLFALVMITVLTLGLVPVNAETTEVNKIEKKWEVEYKLPGYQVYADDLAATEDGIYVIGFYSQTEVEDNTDGDVNGLNILNTDEDAAYIIKYDHNGKVLWEKTHRDGNVYFTGVAAVTDGVVVLVEEYKTKSVSLFKYDAKGNLVSKKVILENYTIDEYDALKMEAYKDTVVVSFDNYLFTYNSKTGAVNSKTYNVNSENKTDSAVIVDIDENGIYVGYHDYTRGASSVAKYNHDLTGEYFAEYSVEGGIVTALSVINDKIIAAIMDPNYESTLLVLDKNFDIVKYTEVEGMSCFYDFAETRDGFAAITKTIVIETTEPLEPEDPVDPADPTVSLTTRKETDVKAATYLQYFNVKFYNNNLTEYLEPIDLKTTTNRIESSVGGLVYCDTVVNLDNLDYSLSLTKLGYEEYTFDVKADENGEVAVTKTEDGKWQVTVTPKEGYQVSKVIVTNSEGSVEYKTATFEADMDDVTIEVVYELIPANPNTGLSNPYVICGIVLVVGVVGYSFLKKKKYI